MYRYHCLKPISQVGLDKFPGKYENNDKIEKNISGYRISGTLKVIEPAAVSVPVSKTQGD